MVYRKPGLQTPLSLSPSVASSTSRFCNSGLESVGKLSFCLPPWICGRSTSRSVQSLAESFSSSSVSSVPLSNLCLHKALVSHSTLKQTTSWRENYSQNDTGLAMKRAGALDERRLEDILRP